MVTFFYKTLTRRKLNEFNDTLKQIIAWDFTQVVNIVVVTSSQSHRSYNVSIIFL